MTGVTRFLAAAAVCLATAPLGCHVPPPPPAEAPEPRPTIAEVEPARDPGPAYLALDLTERYGCALRRDGAVACWGADPAAATGLRASTSRWTEASLVEGVARASAVVVDETQTCVVLEADETVSCWSDGPPRPISGPTEVVEIALVHHEACARTRNAEVWCWEPGDERAKLRFGGAVDIGLGRHQSCAVDELGGVWCWPEDHRIVNAEQRLAGQRVATVEHAVEVFPGHQLCVRTGAGELRCGQLSVERPGTGFVLEAVADLGPTVVYARAQEHGCALAQGGLVRCHGGNGWAQLGDRSSARRTQPVTVELERVANAVAVSDRFSCALTDDRAWCWGTPIVEARALEQVERHVVMHDALRLVSNHHFSCASTTEQLKCWGVFGPGDLDRDAGGIMAAATPTPLRLELGPVVALSNGCFLDDAGELRCGLVGPHDDWCAHETVATGEFVVDHAVSGVEAVARTMVDCVVRRGRASCESRSGDRHSVKVPRLRRITALLRSTGYGVCAIHDGGRLSCFTARPERLEVAVSGPTEVAVPTPVRSLFSRGLDQSCAVTDKGEVWCWRLEFDDDWAPVPERLVRVALPEAVDAAAFAGYTCAATGEGRVACVPDQDASGAAPSWLELEDVVELVGDRDHLCARDSAGTVTCLGSNHLGQLGALPDALMAAPTPIELPALRETG